MTSAKPMPDTAVKPVTVTGVIQGSAAPLDATRLLERDHRELERWFDDYEGLTNDTDRQQVADRICTALIIHMQIEEEILYPAARPEFDDTSLFDEAEIEHGSVRQIISDIRGMKAGDALFNARVIVAGEYIRHHVTEEESEMFPELRDSGLDLKMLGARMAERRAELARLAAGG